MTAVPSEDMSTVLMVRPDPVESVLFGSALAGFGCHVRNANAEKEAVEECRLDPPDLVVMNLSPTEIDGFFTIAKLRSAVGPAVPIIALCPYEDEVVRRQALRVGATFCVAKQYDLNPLKEFVLGVLCFCHKSANANAVDILELDAPSERLESEDSSPWRSTRE